MLSIGRSNPNSLRPDSAVTVDFARLVDLFLITGFEELAATGVDSFAKDILFFPLPLSPLVVDLDLAARLVDDLYYCFVILYSVEGLVFIGLAEYSKLLPLLVVEFDLAARVFDDLYNCLVVLYSIAAGRCVFVGLAEDSFTGFACFVAKVGLNELTFFVSMTVLFFFNVSTTSVVLFSFPLAAL